GQPGQNHLSGQRRYPVQLLNGKTVFGLTEKKAEIRKHPFCPASRQETGFFVTGNSGAVTGKNPRPIVRHVPVPLVVAGQDHLLPGAFTR
ncbi:hypothetical protein NAI82_11075, partial [Oxalobacter sp. JAC-2022]|uniref:hypothetical protein n=1 Tax=Oxalobacter aliiformigenes TaxID=2946593 RepID=UPI0022B03685